MAIGGDPLRRDLAAFHPPAEAPAHAPRGRGRRLLRSAGLALAGAAIGAAGAFTGMHLVGRIDTALPMGVLLVAAVLSVWPHIVLHEAGHAVAGIARGMRPVAFGIGRWRWDRGRSGWRFRRGGPLAGISGFAALLPEGERGLSRRDQALYLLGGPFANLLTAALALGLLWALEAAPVAAAVLAGVGASAALLGLYNLVPFHSQGWRSDGRNLLDLLRRSPEAALQQQIHRLLALNMAGVRPRDWPEALLPPPSEAPVAPMLATNADLLRLSRAMDRGDDAGAAEAALRLTAAFPGLPPPYRPHVAVALAGHAARQLRDPALLAAWRPLCEGGISDLSLLRAWLDAESAALGAGPRAVAEAVAAARQRLDHAPDPVTGLLLREYLDEIEARRRPASL